MYKEPQKLWCQIMQKKYLDCEDSKQILTIANNRGGFVVWRFIWECRKLIEDYLTWKMGKGTKAKFWYDSWNGEIPLDRSWTNQIGSKRQQQNGEFVADFMSQMQEGYGEDWDWDKLDRLIILKEARVTLKAILKQRKITLSPNEPELIRSASKFGDFSIWLGY